MEKKTYTCFHMAFVDPAIAFLLLPSPLQNGCCFWFCNNKSGRLAPMWLQWLQLSLPQ